SNNAFTIPLNSNYKMNVKSLTNIQVNVNSIVMSNFNFYVKPSVQESPENWFIWNGNQILGLSKLGALQKNIVLPSKATSITSNAFYNNKTLEFVDMSLLNIEQLPNNQSLNVSLFTNCVNLINVILPNNFKVINRAMFLNCNNPNFNVSIPTSVTSIGLYAFNGLSNTAKIYVPNDTIRNLVLNSSQSIDPDKVTSNQVIIKNNK
ncbi:MAG: leucine-rich repeat domain-containing protein, partial [Ureaplasma sp.]|nr:leucine-rich repeat domain-containing protein [Ureaplasma sp.]